MIDLTSVATVATLLANGRKILQELLDKNLAAEHKAAVDDAMTAVSEANDRLFDFQSESIKLQQDNKDLTDKLAANDQWEARLAEYQLSKTAGGGFVLAKADPVEHYACPACAENAKKIYPLQDDNNVAGTFSCPKCGKDFPIKSRGRGRPNVVLRS